MTKQLCTWCQFAGVRSDVQTDLLDRFHVAHSKPHVAAGLLTSSLRR
jgi:hypothetical protein